MSFGSRDSLKSLFARFTGYTNRNDRFAELAEQEVNRKRYVERLHLIDGLSNEAHPNGPHRWNISYGQSEFLGIAQRGEFHAKLVLVSTFGSATSEENREKNIEWVDVLPEEIWSQTAGFEVDILRTNEETGKLQADDPITNYIALYRWPNRSAFSFTTFESLWKFLKPLDIEWFGATEAFRILESEGWSPDWGGGD